MSWRPAVRSSWCRSRSSAACRCALRPIRRLKNGLTWSSVSRRSLDAWSLPKSKNVRAIEEEIAALGKEQRKAGEVDLALIDLGLREVGVDGEVGAHERAWGCRRDRCPPSRRRPSSSCRVRAMPRDVNRPYGLMSSPRPCVTLRMPVTMPGVRHPAQPLVARPSRPDALLVLAPDGALKVDAPGVAVRIEVQRAERNLDLDRPADLAAAGARAFQMPSHCRLSPLMPKSESAISPDGFISKK